MPDSGDRARALRIIERVRSYGVQVQVMSGHENRGGTFIVVPTRVFDHHDASSRKSGEWGALGLILDGTPRGIPGPLSNAQVARCLDNVPKIAWVADGTCSHAGLGGPVGDLPLNDANRRAYGVEKANDGIGEPYTAAAMYAAKALFHAMAVECGEIPESFPIGHKEWTDRKSDPVYDMNAMRREVGAFTPGDDDMPSAKEVADEIWTRPVYDIDGKKVTVGAAIGELLREAQQNQRRFLSGQAGVRNEGFFANIKRQLDELRASVGKL